jgi:heme-degrading monooxygenase HmoA
MNKTLWAAAALLVAVAAPAAAQTPPEAQLTVVVVRVPTPWYAPRALVASRMRDTIPEYERLPGLQFKAYSFERGSGDYGGLYLWRTAQQAQAWFGPAWFNRVRAERGVQPQVRFFEAPVSLDNTPGGTPLQRESTTVATLVLINTPAGAARERLVAEFNAALPAYRAVAGLLRKQFIIGEGGQRFGGLYLWQDEASARAWFNEAWSARVLQRYGQAAVIEWFDTPVLLPTSTAP